MNIKDLDILRPAARYIRIDGKDLDVSFIPCGITFEIDELMRELQGLKAEEIQTDNTKAKKAFDISVKLCATFCSRKYPELDEAYFFDNCSAIQLKEFVECIREALINAYKGIGDSGSKNVKARKVQKKGSR